MVDRWPLFLISIAPLVGLYLALIPYVYFVLKPSACSCVPNSISVSGSRSFALSHGAVFFWAFSWLVQKHIG